jgi:hypothetical protein
MQSVVSWMEVKYAGTPRSRSPWHWKWTITYPFQKLSTDILTSHWGTPPTENPPTWRDIYRQLHTIHLLVRGHHNHSDGQNKNYWRCVHPSHWTTACYVHSPRPELSTNVKEKKGTTHPKIQVTADHVPRPPKEKSVTPHRNHMTDHRQVQIYQGQTIPN